MSDWQTPPWNVGDPVHIRVKVSPAKPPSQMVRFTASLIEIARNTFLDCVQYLTHENKKCALRYGQSLNETDSATKSYTKCVWLFAAIEQKSTAAHQNDSEKTLISSGKIHYRDRSNALNAYQLLHLCRRWKAGSELGKVCFGARLCEAAQKTNQDCCAYTVGDIG